jgi:hypothetical protein
MKRTAQILKIKDKKITGADIKEVMQALLADVKSKRITGDEFQWITQRIIERQEHRKEELFQQIETFGQWVQTLTAEWERRGKP